LIIKLQIIAVFGEGGCYREGKQLEDLVFVLAV